MLIFLSFLTVVSFVYAINISPDQWPSGDMEKYIKLNNAFSYDHSEGIGDKTKGVLSGTSSALAVHSGIFGMENGLNAMSAALTTAIAQIALVSGEYVSYAGLMDILYYEAESKKVYHINGGFGSVKNEISPLSIPNCTYYPHVFDESAGRTVMTPGFFKALEFANSKFGNVDFDVLFQPSLYFTKNGFPLNYLLGNSIQNFPTWNRTYEGREIFINPESGKPFKVGEIFKQPQLFEFLSKISENGSDYMYGGEWGEKFVEIVQNHGGKITKEDLLNYKIEISEPRKIEYKKKDKAFTIVVDDKPNYGGVQILEKMNLLEQFEGGKNYTEDARSLYWLIQIERWSELIHLFRFLPSLREKGFPGIDLSEDGRCTKETAAKVWKMMTAPGGIDNIIDIFKKILFVNSGDLTMGKHSDGIVAMDKDGNMVALVHSINTQPWGTGMFVEGVSIPDAACFQREQLYFTVPGEKLGGPEAPAIILDEQGSPFLASTSIGGGLSQVTFQNMYNVMDLDADVKVSVDTKDFLSIKPNEDYLSFPYKQMILKGDFPDSVIQEVERMGQQIYLVTPGTPSSTSVYGYWGGLTHDSKTGTKKASSEFILNGLAESTT